MQSCLCALRVLRCGKEGWRLSWVGDSGQRPVMERCCLTESTASRASTQCHSQPVLWGCTSLGPARWGRQEITTFWGCFFNVVLNRHLCYPSRELGISSQLLSVLCGSFSHNGSLVGDQRPPGFLTESAFNKCFLQGE